MSDRFDELTAIAHVRSWTPEERAEHHALARKRYPALQFTRSDPTVRRGRMSDLRRSAAAAQLPPVKAAGGHPHTGGTT